MTEGPFKETTLTIRDHEDPSKHFMGETLPIPSIGDVSVAGFVSGTGTSPIPARADHTHDNRFRWGSVRNVSGKTCAGTSGGTKTYIDGLSYFDGYDMLGASTQLMVPNRDGLYLSRIWYQITRSTGTFPATTFFDINVEYNGAATAHLLIRDILPAGKSSFLGNETAIATLTGSGDLQWAYQNFDTVNHTFVVHRIETIRLCSSVQA